MNPDLAEFFRRELERRAAERTNSSRAAQPGCGCAFHVGVAALSRQDKRPTEGGLELDYKKIPGE